MLLQNGLKDEEKVLSPKVPGSERVFFHLFVCFELCQEIKHISSRHLTLLSSSLHQKYIPPRRLPLVLSGSTGFLFQIQASKSIAPSWWKWGSGGGVPLLPTWNHLGVLSCLICARGSLLPPSLLPLSPSLTFPSSLSPSLLSSVASEHLLCVLL